MMHETDLPCSECGTELEERETHARELPVSTEWRGYVTVAQCPRCGARHYPDRTLAKLGTSSNDGTRRGDS